MSIRGVSGAGHHVQAVRAAYEVAASARPRATEVRADTKDQATSVRVSPGAELLAKLRTLHDGAPKAFQQLMTQLASDTETAASHIGLPRSAEAPLRTLAERFQAAAKDGNLTPLVPPLEVGAHARAAYAMQIDALSGPNAHVQALLKSFVAKVDPMLPTHPHRGAGR